MHPPMTSLLSNARLATLLCTVSCAGVALAQTAPPIPVELRSRFGFDGPVITKIGDGISSLRVADTDNDGRLDVVVSDPRRARLAIVRLDEDGNATKDAIPTDGQIGGFSFGDFDGDGKTDLLTTTSRGRLQLVRLAQDETTELLDLGLGGRGIGMYAGDLDGDGADDVVAISRDGLRYVTQLGKQPVLSRIEPWENNAHSFHLIDYDSDGKLDMTYVVSTPTMNLRLRRNNGDGTFGPWQLASIDSLHHVFPARIAGGAQGLATIDGPNRRLTMQRFAPSGGRARLEWWSLPGAKGTGALPFAIGDIDNDGDDDLVMAQPDQAQLLVFEWTGRTFAMQTVPTLAGVSSLALGDIDGDGKVDLAIASDEEETLAWKSGTADLTAFPTPIDCQDKPAAVAIAPDGGLVVLTRDSRRNGALYRVAPGAEPKKVAKMGRLSSAPPRLVLADVGDAEGLEAAFVGPDGLVVVTLPDKASATVLDVDAKDGAAGFTKRMADGALLLCEEGGQPALMAVRERFLRRFRVGPTGRLHVLAQDNGPAGITEMSLAADLPDGSRVYLDSKADKLTRVQDGGMPTSIDVPPLPFTHIAAHGTAVLLLGPQGVLRVPFGPGPALETVAIHEPPTVRTHYWHGLAGDFDGDGTTDLAVIDGHLPGLQIIAGGENTLARALAMPVYEAPPSDESHREPRDVQVGDINGDGRMDIVLLAFDRVLVYLQQP